MEEGSKWRGFPEPDEAGPGERLAMIHDPGALTKGEEGDEV